MTFAMANTPAERAKIGGKAYNLIHLSSCGFNVPPFFVLDSDCFNEFLGENLGEYKSLLENYGAEAREKIAELVSSSEFSPNARRLIEEKIDEVFSGRDILFSVRSSANDEDSEKNSFAGMMDSFLFVKRDEVIERIKDCYLSCFSERIMKYRESNGLINGSIGVSVIVEEMIAPDFAGVMFTIDPKTNNTDEILISLVDGVGEGLVSGEKNSDDYVLDYFGEIISRPEKPEVALGDEMILKLGELAKEIEESYSHKCPQDIEFCVKDGEVFILQARPVATASHINKRAFRTILDNSNIIESYSGVTTPLTFTFAREVYAKVYNQTLKNFFVKQENIDEIQDDLSNMLCFYENKIYYRLNSWYRMTSLYPGYETNKKYMENMMGVKTALRESPSQAKARLAKIYIRAIYKFARIKGDSEKFKTRFNEVTAPYYNNNFEGYSNEALLGVYNELEEKILDDFTTPITNDMGTMVIFGMLTDKLKKLKIDNYEGLLSDILSKQGEVESAMQSLSLMEIVKKIRNSQELSAEFKDSSMDELKAKLKGGEGVYSDIREYIYRFGARTMDELKLETVTLLEDPEFLFTTIKQYLELPDSTEVYRESETDDDAAYRALIDVCPTGQKTLIKALVKLTKFFIRNRESLRLRRTHIYSIVRKIFLRIGENLKCAGILSDGRDIFFLTKDEITSIIYGKYGDTSDIPEKIASRRAEYIANQPKAIYERMYFYGDIAKENMLPIYSKNQIQNTDGVLTGVAGGGKVVEGIVKLVTDPADADVKGYILMAKRTDPGWTVIFPMADAIIIERGSVLSHSAVVAREMGLTLVVGVRGLTDIVKDGDRVRVDGRSGTIEILEKQG